MPLVSLGDRLFLEQANAYSRERATELSCMVHISRLAPPGYLVKVASRWVTGERVALVVGDHNRDF